ncbi:MAG TPA: divergent polysaccharide deacetylase family protein [Stellaceae bacterium]|nr:divergent polysaccharide deacetylase family protein [Stellaceae bacterium]
MDDKLEEFVALLRRPGPRPARPRARPRPPVPAAARLLQRRHIIWSWPILSLPTPSPRLWVNLGCGAAALAVIAIATWVALPSPQPEPQLALDAPVTATTPVAPPATAPVPVSAPRPAPPAANARITLPFPAAPDEEGEAVVPDDATRAAALPPVPSGTRLAALPPPVPARRGEPAWLRFAVPPPPVDGRPEIAIVLDDVGLDRKGAERAIALPEPVTLSFMAYATDLPQMAEAAHRNGHELMLHVPMEPISRSEDMGPNGLSVDLSRDEVLRRLRWDLDRFDGYVGINNHMGSRFTADAAGMSWVLEELKARGLLFLDSRTIGNSVGIELARKFGVPHAGRDVFLDNVIEPAAIEAQLAETEEIARRHGSAIAIGHPHDVTLDVLTPWLAGLKAKGFVLVPLSTIVRQRTLLAGGSTG